MASVSSSGEEEVKGCVAVPKDSDTVDSSDGDASGPIVTLDSKVDAGDLTYNTLSSSTSQMLLKPTDHIRRLSRVFVNFFQSVPASDSVLSQHLQETWSDFARKYPFFFSIVHRKFKLENDFSFRIHTRTLFAFDLPSDTALKVRVDLKKAKSLFGEEIQSPRFQHIFQNPRILELTRGEGDYVEMAEARELVKLVCDSLCPMPTSNGGPNIASVQPFLDNVPMFSVHVIFCSQATGVRSRCRHSMIQLLRREFITMLSSVVISCALPSQVDGVQREVLESGIANCWDSDVIEKQSQQESLWMKISLRLYTLIGTLINTGKYDDQRLGLILRLWKQADQNAEAQLHRAKDVQRKRRRSIDDKNVGASSALSLNVEGNNPSRIRQNLEGHCIGPWNLDSNSISGSVGMLPASLNPLQQLHSMLQMQQMQNMARVNPSQLQAFQLMQQQLAMQQQLISQRMFHPSVNPFSMTGLGVYNTPSNFIGHEKMSMNAASASVGSFPPNSQMWPGICMPDSFPSPAMMMHAGNMNPNPTNAHFNSMLAPIFPMMTTQATMYPWMCNQPMMTQILGGGPNVAADPSLSFHSASDPRAFFVPMKSTAKNTESGYKLDLSSNLQSPVTAVEPNSIMPKL
jgi:hypothetical protein